MLGHIRRDDSFKGMSQLILVTLPKKGTSLQTIAGELPTDKCQISKVEIPALVVGTLDSLLALSDELVKSSAQVEVHLVLSIPL
ncbi:hypothetical protein EON65_06675 [archaeon]|nr:MAG: hypothetical protein EON65_06675 [archaeon]